MKRQIQLALIAAFAMSIMLAEAQDKKDGKITVEITKEINGEKKTFKGEYENEEQMRADPNYQEFAGDDDDFNVWFSPDDYDHDFFIDIDRLKNADKSFFNFHFGDEDEGGVKIFRHFDGDSSGFLHLDGWDMEEYSEHMEKLSEEIKDMMQRFGTDDDDRVYVITSKRIKVLEVDGDEFGKKGEVAENNKLDLSDLNFYPNPSSNGRFKVRFSVPEEGELSIKVFNLDGKEVYNRYFERYGGLYSETIDLSGQQEGIYLMEISLNKRRLTRKIVIN